METNETVKKFFQEESPPAGYEDTCDKLKQFIEVNLKAGRKVALVTSGGTTVPLERNTVRFVDNFSGGGRGSAATENFIEQGYAVIFLFRKTSLQPYSRFYLQHAGSNFLDYFALSSSSGKVEVDSSLYNSIADSFHKYSDAMHNSKLLKVPFQSVHDYLFLLRAATTAIAPLKKNALLFVAAAVSDFYIPTPKMSEHKIQSSESGLDLHLDPVPKMLGLVRHQWCPEAFFVSFKLETDPSRLSYKATTSLKSYGQQVVIGNLLTSYKDKVEFYMQGTPEKPFSLERTTEEKEAGVDLEVRIVKELVAKHSQYSK
eukprot:TRINITY_DN10681_c0_g1_i1.p1 TRINITY_DN10681_c0_g1~~TRINITY_DN10681_c0_g1_i1.p1  ORF type:complete len:315 (-),score=54.16 TRINITY_DN10681_c0_g1_i1:13-957(-)